MKRCLLLCVLFTVESAACSGNAEPPSAPAAPPEASGAVAAATPTAPSPVAAAEPASQPTAAPGSGAPPPPHDGLGIGRTPPDQAPGTTAHYGYAFASNAAPVPIETAVTTCRPQATCRITARVAAVCQAKGCWFTLVSPGLDREVRVKMEGYSFFMPRNAAGGEVVAEGKLEAKIIPQAEAQHYADDEAKAGKPARVVTGDVKSWSFMAHGVDLTLPAGAAP